MTDPNTTPQGCSRGFVISATIVFVIAVCLVGPAILHLRENARREHSRNRLKQLGLAIYSYYDTFQRFPPGGVFDNQGIGYHGWTSSIAPYLDASPWFSLVDFRIPWDDPRQVALFRDWSTQQSRHWSNPSVSPVHRSDGLVFNHYAGNQTIFYRNSSVDPFRDEVNNGTLLVADALDNFAPVGSPFAWRDLTLGLMTTTDGFGCLPRNMTQCLMADGSVREIAGMADPSVVTGMAGPLKRLPTADQVAKPQDYPLIDVSRIWRIEWIPDDDQMRKNDRFRRIPPPGWKDDSHSN